MDIIFLRVYDLISGEKMEMRRVLEYEGRDAKLVYNFSGNEPNFIASPDQSK